MNNIDVNSVVTVEGPSGPVKTNLGVLLAAAGVTLPAQNTTTAGTRKRKIVAPIASNKGPASPDELMSAVGALASKPSVVVSASVGKTHEAVTIHLTKEFAPGKTDGEEFLVVRRLRRQDDGTITADDKQNFAFDKSFCFYRGPRPDDKQPAAGPEWKLHKQTTTVAGVPGTFWSRYVPMDSAKVLMEGLRTHFSGATLVVEGKTLKL